MVHRRPASLRPFASDVRRHLGGSALIREFGLAVAVVALHLGGVGRSGRRGAPPHGAPAGDAGALGPRGGSAPPPHRGAGVGGATRRRNRLHAGGADGRRASLGSRYVRIVVRHGSN